MNFDDLSDESMCKLISMLADKLAARRGGVEAQSNHEDRLIRPSINNVDDPVLAIAAEAEYRARSARRIHFDRDLLGEPFWDIMLDMFVQQVRGRRVSVTSCAIASGVPPTTALRWIADMEAKGFLKRCRDSEDRRRQFLELTQSGLASMRSVFRRRTVQSIEGNETEKPDSFMFGIAEPKKSGACS